MPRKIDTTLIDHAIYLVRNGMLVGEAAKEVGINSSTLSHKFKERGFNPPVGRGRPKKLNLPIDDIKSMYESGKSENAVAKHFGTDRGTIRKRLIEAGVKPRSQSEAEKLKWSQMDEDTRANQVKHAHDAVRGVPRREAECIARAKAREHLKHDHFIGYGEIEFCNLLADRGIDFTHQKAVGPYNVDIAIGSVAVELTGHCGRYSMFNPKEINRSTKLLERGYHVLAVEFDSVTTLIKCADDIIADIDAVSRLKPIDRQYRVIRCRMQDYTIVTNKLGQFTSVPAPVKYLTKRTVIDLD